MLKIKHLKKTYRGFSLDCSMEVRPGMITGLIGRNGAGKSTTFKAILISSHISSDLETLCDDLYMIHDGNIILHEDTDVLLGSYAVMKVPEKLYEKLEKTYLLKTKKEAYGYCCLTDQKQFYLENYPEIVIENGNIDDLIGMLNGGSKV